MNKPLRVCYFGTYRANYNRNQMMIAGLRLNGVEVVECHETLWHGIADRVETTTGGWRKPAFWGRVIAAYARLLWKYLHVGKYDVLMVGYPGQFDVFLARKLAWLSGKPLVWDVFMSIYLVALERGLDAYSQFVVNMLRRLERLALHLPDRLIQDTAEYVDWLHQIHGIPAERFRLVPTGADDRIYQPAAQPPSADGRFRVLYAGTFIPNHGVTYMIEAARLLADEPAILLEMVGDGPEREPALRLAQRYNLPNVTFTEWLEKEELAQRLAQADVCLGAFGTTPQSLMTVQNKIFESAAMGKPMISGDSPAVRAAFEPGQEIILCPREDAAALAQAVRTLWQDPALRAQLAQNSHRRFKEQYSLEKNGARCAAHLREVIK